MSDAFGDRGAEPIAVSVRQAAALLGIGRSTIYLYIASGEIEVIKVCSHLDADGELEGVCRSPQSPTRRAKAMIEINSHLDGTCPGLQKSPLLAAIFYRKTHTILNLYY